MLALLSGPLDQFWSELTMSPRSLESVSWRLELARNAMGLSNGEFCRRAGMTTSAYSQYESGKHRPSLEHAFRLCDAFGYTLDWIYLGNKAGLPHDLAMKIAEQEVAPRQVVAKRGRPRTAPQLRIVGTAD